MRGIGRFFRREVVGAGQPMIAPHPGVDWHRQAMKSSFAFLIAFALCAGQSHGAQARSATVVGLVRDTNGGPLPGVMLTVTLGTSEVRAVADPQGRYSIALPPGSHTIRVTLAGFLTAEKRAQLIPGETATVNFDLVAGPLRFIDWIAPPERLAELVATAHTVAHLRVTATGSAAECKREARITANVIEALTPPGLTAGATLTFCQEQWEAERTPYPVGTELVVLLIEWNGTLARSHGPHAVFRVEDSKIQASPFLFPAYHGYVGMAVTQFLAELRVLLTLR